MMTELLDPRDEQSAMVCTLGGCNPVALTLNSSCSGSPRLTGSQSTEVPPSKEDEDQEEDDLPPPVSIAAAGRVISPLPANFHEKVKGWLDEPRQSLLDSKPSRKSGDNSSRSRLSPTELEGGNMVALRPLPRGFHEKIRRLQQEAQALAEDHAEEASL
mmetsp:Transcript_34249/g.78070  ORF Transcript_34249/g.78070 Transcript_34249/m.78070 type:complete len:159 (-) Transcript_34249:7-483(-)